MISKIYLTEPEYDLENFEIQSQYRYCKQCGLFYHVDSIGKRCGHPHGYFTVQEERERLVEDNFFDTIKRMRDGL